MKIVELTTKILMPITNEESQLLDRFSDGEILSKNQLNEREQLLANQLTVRDVLLRTNENGKIYYRKRI
jgi:hypothetical protein